jgi:AcrR family transcriptional regulator
MEYAPTSVAHPIRQLTRRERKRDITRARLFEAALAEFRRVGFDRSSVSQIAREAGVSRASFYFHYPTKEHVLLELQWGLQQAMAERVAARASLRSALHELVDAVIDAESSVEDADLHRDMLMIHVRRPETLGLAELPSPIQDEMLRQFSAGAERGELRSGLDPAQATDLCLKSVFGFLIGNDQPIAACRTDLLTLVSLYLPEDGS